MNPFPFQYPVTPLVRRHAPGGYQHWEPYRDWLRDEFDFRCVYCLQRESWGKRRAIFAIDHIVARAAGGAPFDYGNLAYVCASCNSNKSDEAVPHPAKCAYGRSVSVDKEGRIAAHDPDGRQLIRALCLDDEENTRYRRMMLRLLRDQAEHDRSEFNRMMSYPADLPDLESRRPPTNDKPDSWKQSHHARGDAGKIY
jgi:hypothetical protein